MFKRISGDTLVKGSIVMILMLGIFNLLNYVFQMAMARMLGPADYGALAVIMSIAYIFGIPNEAIQTIITRYTSRFHARKKDGKIKSLLSRSLRRGFMFSSIAFVIFLIISIFLSDILKMSYSLLALTGILLFFAFSIPIVRGVLQGKKRFLGLGINMVLESGIKVTVAAILVFAGWKVYGAVVGLLIAGFVALIVAFSSIREIIISKREEDDFEGIYRYNLPVLIGISAIILIYSLDVILARIFFSAEVAGTYAFVSLIGKAILFSSFAISKAMFPISSQRFEIGEKTGPVLKKSIIFVLFIGAVFLVLSILIPTQMIRAISLGSLDYLSASGILVIVSLAFTFTALVNVMITYSLSIDKMRASSIFLMGFVILEVGLLSIFHSNLNEFAMSILTVNLLMFLYSLWIIRR